MTHEINLTIDNVAVKIKHGATLMEAAALAGIYIPHLCSHPGLPPLEEIQPCMEIYCAETQFVGVARNNAKLPKCRLCLVEVDSKEEFVTACDTRAADNMKVVTSSPKVQEERKKNLIRILGEHPHACIICKHKDGCDRINCSQGVPKQERCCEIFDYCEFNAIAAFIGIDSDIPKHKHKNLPSEKVLSLARDHNLCIQCLRCVRACQSAAKKDILGFVYSSNGIVVGKKKLDLKDSGCIFCGACADVCPTGALLAKKAKMPKHAKTKKPDVPHPNTGRLGFCSESVNSVPEKCGTFELLNDKKSIIYIAGTSNLKSELQNKLETVPEAKYFTFEENEMYTMRESELLQKFVKQHGKLPELNDISGLY